MHAFCCCTSRNARSTLFGREETASRPHSASNNPPVPVASPPRPAKQAQGRSSCHPPSRPLTSAVAASSFQGPPALDELVVEDDSDNGDDASQSAKRSTGTLDVVRTKIIRHISQDNESRQSRSAVGHSEEELARRAELRRFRQKRIQDELEKEDGNDNGSNRSHLSTRYLSPLIDLGQPGTGPRDAIEFTVDGGATLPATTLPSLDNGHRRGSCPELLQFNQDHVPSLKAASRETLRMASAVPAIAASPPCSSSSAALQPVNSQESAGYASGSHHLDKVLGKDNDFDIRHGSHAWEDQSALGLWLMAQGMRSRDNSLIRLGDPEPDKTACPGRVRSSSLGFGGIDSVIGTSVPGLETRTTLLMQPPETQSGVLPCRNRVNNTTATSHSTEEARQERSGLCQQKPEALSKIQDPQTVSQPSIDQASSNYPSALPSLQTSPHCSLVNDYGLSLRDLDNLELSPFMCKRTASGKLMYADAIGLGNGSLSITKDFGHSEAPSSYATAEDNISATDKSGALGSRNRPTNPSDLDSKSIAQSETTSFRQREAELQTIEERFADVLSKKKTLTPVHSRFQENFSPTTIDTPTRTSFVTKLHSSISRLSRTGSNSLGSIENRQTTAASRRLKPAAGEVLQTLGGIPLPIDMSSVDRMGLRNMTAFDRLERVDSASSLKRSVLQTMRNGLRELPHGATQERSLEAPRQSLTNANPTLSGSTAKIRPRSGSGTESHQAQDAGSVALEIAAGSAPSRGSSEAMAQQFKSLKHSGKIGVNGEWAMERESQVRGQAILPAPMARFPFMAGRLPGQYSNINLSQDASTDCHATVNMSPRNEGEKEVREARNGQNWRPFPERLGKAFRSGLGKLLHGKNGWGPEGSMEVDGRNFSSGSVTGHDRETTVPTQYLSKQQEDRVTKARGSQGLESHPDMPGRPGSSTSVLHPNIPAGGQRAFEMNKLATNKSKSNDSCDPLATPGSRKGVHDVFVTPATSRTHEDATDDDEGAVGLELTERDSAAAMRRWKSTGEQRSKRERPSPWAKRSMTNPPET